MTELNFYQKVLVDLKLVGNEEAEGVFRYISNTYPEVTEDSCEKLIGMLALLFPDLDYGGRGITVCDEWDDFITFKKWAEERGYNDTSVIDKIDNDKGYCPENCRWVGWKESGSNRSNVKMIEFSGEAMHLSAWSEYLGIKRKTLFNRLYKLDWNVEESFTIPVGKSRRNREVVQ